MNRPEEKRKKKKAKTASTLSFALDDEEEETLVPRKNKKAKTSHEGDDAPAPKLSFKNPSVDTSFLPDRKREEEDRKVREELRQEWLRKQEDMKKEDIEITYSYWDGSGHRKAVKCKKGDSIAQFLEKCRQQVPELRGVSVDNMMYIKVRHFGTRTGSTTSDRVSSAGGSDHPAPLHVLRLHRKQVARQVWPALQLRRARRYSIGCRCDN